MTTLSHNRWHTLVVLIWCWKPRSFPESYRSPVHNGSLDELAVLSVEASAAISKKVREPERRPAVGEDERRENILLRTPFLWSARRGPPTTKAGLSTPTNAGGAGLQVRRPTQLVLACGEVALKPTTQKRWSSPNSQIHRFKTKIFSGGPTLEKCWQDPFRLEWKVMRQESRTT